MAKRLMMGGASSHRSSYSSIQLSSACQGTWEVLVSCPSSRVSVAALIHSVDAHQVWLFNTPEGFNCMIDESASEIIL